MNTRRVLLLFSFVLAGMSATNSAIACTCFGEQTVADAYRTAPGVFLAEVLSVQHTPCAARYVCRWPALALHEIARIRILKSWKGPYRVGDEIVYRRVLSLGNCEECFRAGKWSIAEGRIIAEPSNTWLIYGSREHGPSACTRSTPIDPANPSDEIRMLDTLATAGGQPSK